MNDTETAKIILNAMIGAGGTAIQFVQNIQSIIAIFVGLLTIVYLTFQIIIAFRKIKNKNRN